MGSLLVEASWGGLPHRLYNSQIDCHVVSTNEYKFQHMFKIWLGPQCWIFLIVSVVTYSCLPQRIKKDMQHIYSAYEKIKNVRNFAFSYHPNRYLIVIPLIL